ncbi:hypothetical protein ACIBBB_30825 [Streptomyces sp. NPDC051217]|uniref:hypothetical protein n=1 Tax=Streptomyces sp. NPDC051217 TaxID=3365644 RepID=UPI0037A88EE0
MGSMRNPVGPLPSSIYWRRRAVAATLIALLALLVVWVVTSGGDDGGKKRDDGANGEAPPPSITPGPSGSGPAISEQPGGRDESGETGGSDGPGSGGTDAGSGADGGAGGDNGGAGTGGSAGSGGGAASGGSGGSAGDGASGSTTGEQVPVGSSLPNCSPSALTVKLESRKVAYEPGEKPSFRLVATNGSGKDCKADLGPKSVVLTVTNSESDEIWSSKDCPRIGQLLLKVPAGGTVTRTVVWDLTQSVPRCATPPPGKAKPGTYLVEAAAPDATVRQGQTSIRLDKD